MNTTLGTGDAPLSPGFLAWREMCATTPNLTWRACSHAAIRR
jgi:tRNA(adenine34) deaminase